MTRKKQAAAPTKQMSGVGYGQPWPGLWILRSGIYDARAPTLGHTGMLDSLN